MHHQPIRHAVRTGCRVGIAGLLATLAFALCVVGAARASVAIALELRDLVIESDVIAVARVIDRRSYWDEHQRIVTDVRLVVEEDWLGRWPVGEELMVRTLGGALEDLALHVAGEPQFWEHELVVLFARANPRVPWLRATGASQGVMHTTGGSAGVTLVHPGGEGQHLVRLSQGRLYAAPPAVGEATELDVLRARVRSLLDEVGRD